MMKHPFFLLAFVLFFAPQTFSQSYMTAGGLRFGTDWGLTVNQRVAERLTVEAILQSSLQREEIQVTGLLKRHYPLVFRGLNFYLGGGLHKGWYTPENMDGTTENGGDPFGFTVIAGLELSLARSINLSYDFKPALNVTGGERAFYPQSGLSIRYVFKDDKEYQQRLRQERRDDRKAKRKDWWEAEKWKVWKGIEN